ncbi:MAG: DUF4142 domain-containing protein [Candidatus Cyclobacteriaceae bacterium M2_1C_046]
MKKLIYTLSIIFLSACGSSLTYNEAIEKNNDNYENKEARQDAIFLVDAKSSSLLLKQIGDLGVERGYATVVQNFATKISTDHEGLNERLNSLAKSEKIKVPAEMSERHQQMFNELQTSTRQEFDKNFVRMVERIYEDNIELYKTIATDANDDEIRAFAAQHLNFLRRNEEQADQMEDELI